MKIIVVGGGAGGLELVTKLGKKLGRKGLAEVTLIDRNSVHLWKPLLHEVASGSLDANVEGVSYRAQAHNKGFIFKLGSLAGVDSKEKKIHLEPIYDETGEEILPSRVLDYDILVLAIGSESNDFAIEGVKEHCFFLDRPSQAIQFQRRLVNQFIRLNKKLEIDPSASLSIAIIGGGATGVELSAELFNARHWFASYGLRNLAHKHLQVTLIEAGPRLLPALSERIAISVQRELKELGLTILLDTQITRAEKKQLITKDGLSISADLMVWAAGVKASPLLTTIEGLETNRINQVIVGPSLQALNNSDIYVLGDCAGFKLDDKHWVPPRAQAAHQMASVVAKNIIRSLGNKPPVAFQYRDHGSLVSLSSYTAVGTLMGNLAHGTLNIEGKLARMAYISLYRMHQVALHGWVKTILIAFAERINRVLRPRLKLH